MDYFKKILIDLESDDVWVNESEKKRLYSIYEIWNKDVEEYRNHSIKHYNNDEERGTDKYCLQMFLNTYTACINIFNLHSELNAKKVFNGLINYGWMVYNDMNDED